MCHKFIYNIDTQTVTHWHFIVYKGLCTSVSVRLSANLPAIKHSDPIVVLTYAFVRVLQSLCNSVTETL